MALHWTRDRDVALGSAAEGGSRELDISGNCSYCGASVTRARHDTRVVKEKSRDYSGHRRSIRDARKAIKYGFVWPTEIEAEDKHIEAPHCTIPVGD